MGGTMLWFNPVAWRVSPNDTPAVDACADVEADAG
jgi:hypothetical protein